MTGATVTRATVTRAAVTGAAVTGAAVTAAAVVPVVLGALVGVLAAGVRWSGRHLRWPLSWALLGCGLLLLGARPVLVAAVAVLGLFPGLVCGVWSRSWPSGYERCCSGPWRRWGWRKWARRSWPTIARACGLSVEASATKRAREWREGKVVASSARVVKTWTDPRLLAAITGSGTGRGAGGGTLTLRVRARLGQSVEELASVAPKLRDAAAAHSVRCVQHSPSVLDIALVMVDPLAGTRLAAPAAPAATAAATGAGALVPLPGAGGVVVGRGEDGADVVVDLADPWHLATQGATRSGKSALTYTLLGAVAARADVLVCGVDPSGILLGPFAAGRGGGWIATGTTDLSCAVDALAGVVAQMDARIARLVQDGAEKVEVFDAGCPLLVVVLEEYPGTLSAARSQDEAQGRTGADKIAPRIERCVGRLVKEGAKVGVRVLVLAQRMSAKAVDTDDRSNFGWRVTLRVDNGDAVAMLHDGPTARTYVEAARQFPPGMGLVEGPGTPLQRWRADLTRYPTYRDLVGYGIATTATVPGAFAAPAAMAAPIQGAPIGDLGDLGQPAEPRAARKPRAPRAPRAPRQARPGAASEDRVGTGGGAA